MFLMALVGCATSETAAYAPETIASSEAGGRQMTPGVKQEGNVLVSVGCVPASFGISLGRTGGARQATRQAAQAVCATGRADLSGSQIGDWSAVGDALCVEVRTPIDGISCLPAPSPSELARERACTTAHRVTWSGHDIDSVRRRAAAAFDELDDPNCN